MKRTVSVKGVTIGEGAPKICVPMTGETMEQLREEARLLVNAEFDVVEWRVDFFRVVEEIEMVELALKEIREILPQVPLIFTFRSAQEGGERSVSADYYFKLNRMAVHSGLVDLIDVELFQEESEVRSLVSEAQRNHLSVIISNHDFEKTPAKEEIISRLQKAQELGGDLPKIAVMPKSPADVLTLLDATLTMKEQYADRPIITMSMAGFGVISRLTGELFGSALTFGSVKRASAPGQVPVTELKSVLSLIHSSL